MWPARFANMIVNCPSARTKPAQATVVTASRKAGPKDRETLFSWVIAPVSGT
jgi:hypothetical protein